VHCLPHNACVGDGAISNSPESYHADINTAYAALSALHSSLSHRAIKSAIAPKPTCDPGPLDGNVVVAREGFNPTLIALKISAKPFDLSTRFSELRAPIFMLVLMDRWPTKLYENAYERIGPVDHNSFVFGPSGNFYLAFSIQRAVRANLILLIQVSDKPFVTFGNNVSRLHIRRHFREVCYSGTQAEFEVAQYLIVDPQFQI
jgi:hypothetical protein